LISDYNKSCNTVKKINGNIYKFSYLVHSACLRSHARSISIEQRNGIEIKVAPIFIVSSRIGTRWSRTRCAVNPNMSARSSRNAPKILTYLEEKLHRRLHCNLHILPRTSTEKIYNNNDKAY